MTVYVCECACVFSGLAIETEIDLRSCFEPFLMLFCPEIIPKKYSSLVDSWLIIHLIPHLVYGLILKLSVHYLKALLSPDCRER